MHGTESYRLKLAGNDRWGEPLAGMVAGCLTEDLVERLPQAAVYTEAGAISTRPDTVLEIDIQRLDADADGTLGACWPRWRCAGRGNRCGFHHPADRAARFHGAGHHAGAGGGDECGARPLADRVAQMISGG